VRALPVDIVDELECVALSSGLAREETDNKRIPNAFLTAEAAEIGLTNGSNGLSNISLAREDAEEGSQTRQLHSPRLRRPSEGIRVGA